nr:unnamed protein product [Digitaria exilis]
MPKRTVATLWMLLLGLAAAATAGVLQASAQPDSIGFISIDCGLPGTANSVDDTTTLSYAPDAAFTDAGSNQNISVEYITPSLSKRYLNVRTFPNGVRNCYTLRSLEAGLKYLLRAEFMYGNYDGLNKPPIFDLYAGVNFWSMVNVSTPDGIVTLEAVVVVCLVDTGSGTPFISALELRPHKTSLYPQANATQGLVLFARRNFGTTDATDIVRQGHITPLNASSNISLFWDSAPQPRDPTPRYMAIMHFSELVRLSGTAVREFFIEVNDVVWQSSLGFRPDYLFSDSSYSTAPLPASTRYTIHINATANSTLPPFINAIEVYSVISTTNVGTESSDVSAITAIKDKYRVQKNWAGDPCSPKTFAWDGLTCSYAVSSYSRITAM